MEYHVVAPTSPPGAEKSATQPEDGGPSGATEVKVDESLQEDGRGLLKGRNTSIKSLIALFLKHYRNAEGATIEVSVWQCSTCTLYMVEVGYGGGCTSILYMSCTCTVSGVPRQVYCNLIMYN